MHEKKIFKFQFYRTIDVKAFSQLWFFTKFCLYFLLDSAFLTERMQSSFVCTFPCNEEAIRPQSSTTLPPAGDSVEWHIDTRDHPICSIIPLSWAKRYCRLNIWVGFVWARLALDGCIALERPLYQCPICDLLYKKHIFSWTEQNKKIPIKTKNRPRIEWQFGCLCIGAHLSSFTTVSVTFF